MVSGGSDFLQIPSRLIGDGGIVQGDTVQPDDGVHGRTDFVAHVGQEGRLGPVGCLRCGQGILERLPLRLGLPGFKIHVHKARARDMHQLILPVLRMAHAGKAHLLPGLPPMAVGQVSAGDHPPRLQPGLHVFRLNEAQEFFPVLFPDVFVGIGGDGREIVEPFSRPESVLQVLMRLIAYSVPVIQIDIIDAPVVRSQGGNHPGLFFLLLFLGQQLLLQAQPLLHFLLLHPVFGVRGFLFQRQLGVFPDLQDNKAEEPQQNQHGKQGLQEASPKDVAGNASETVADHALPDQVGQQPVGAIHRHIAHRFLNAVIGEAGLALLALGKFTREFFVGIPGVKLRAAHGLQQVILHRLAPQHGVAQGDAVPGVNIAEGGPSFLSVHGNAGEHFLHVDLHEAGHQLCVKKGKIRRNRNDDLFVGAVQIFHLDFRPLQRVVIDVVPV